MENKGLILIAVIMLVLLGSAGITIASDAGTESREVSGTVEYSKERLILKNSKEKVILSLLAPAALDSLSFHPLNDDTLTARGFMSKGALVVKEAVWKGNTYIFRDSLWQFSRKELGGSKVNPKGCISCKLCTIYCPMGAITMQQTELGVKAVIDQTLCTGCNICIAGNNVRYMGCPTKAITK